MNEYFVAWWNLENLFSEFDDPARSQWLQRYVGRELEGWTTEILQRKLDQLAAVIRRMNDGQGPDLLGVCEVENESVLRRLIQAVGLPSRQYDIVHHNSCDKRGIDVAYIYDTQRFSIKPDEIFHHIIQKRTATRDLLQVNFYTRPENNVLICIGNHWPARVGGVLESEPYRMLAGETLSYWMTRIHEVFADRAVEEGRVPTPSRAVPPSVLVMGDFNDEPFNRALTHYALAERVERKVKSRRSTKPYLLNLMWPLMGSGHRTHVYDGSPGMLDQFMVNRGMLDEESPISLARVTIAGREVPFVGIIKFAEMVHATGSSAGGPRRFGRPAKPHQFNRDGFSDHFPIAIKVLERTGDEAGTG